MTVATRAEECAAAVQKGLGRRGKPRSLAAATAIALDQLVGRTIGRKGQAVMWANRSRDFKRHLQYSTLPRGTGRKISGECMVDVSIFRAGAVDPFLPLATAESEAYPYHWPLDDTELTSENLDYLWDLYKLMQVPSPIRLFTCIVASKNGRAGRVQEAAEALIHAYAGQCMRRDDEIFLVVIPNGRGSIDSECVGWRMTARSLELSGRCPLWSERSSEDGADG